jgi:hypothetical protein
MIVILQERQEKKQNPDAPSSRAYDFNYQFESNDAHLYSPI